MDGAFSARSRLLVPGRIALVDRDDVAILVAELEFEQAVLQRLEPGRAAERVPERGVFERRQRRQHAPGAEQLFLQARDARQHLERRIEIVAAHAFEHVVELVQEQAHPQLRHLVHDDEQHLVLLDGVRLLRVEQFVELQVFAVGLRGAEVPVHAFVLEIDALFFVIVLSSSEKTQRGTWRHPCTSSRSSARQSAQWRSTACQNRAEWFMCLTCVSSCTMR